MNFRQSLTIMCLMMMASMCYGHFDSPQVYCGRTLARVIAFLCYDEPMNEKRSEIGTMYNRILTPYYKDQEEHSWPWMPHQIARSMNMGSRNKRQVVSECCDKPCDINVLLSYC